jgi:hypothetical protein
MSLRIRRGTEAERSGLSTVDQGELLWVTNAQKLYVGLGNGQAGNNGMVNIGAALAGDGLAWDVATQTLKFGGVNYTTDDVQEGIIAGRQYFTEERAVDAVASALVAGVGNVTFVYNTTQDDARGGLGRIDASVTLDGIGITSVEADTSPTLGGDLDANSKNITGAVNVGLTGILTAGPIIVNNGVITSSVLYNAGVGGVRSDNPVIIGTNAIPSTLWIESDNNGLIITGLSDGTNNAGISTRISRGTKAVPTIVEPGDALIFLEGSGYDGTAFVNRGAIGLFADPTWTGTIGVGSSIPTAFGAVVLDEFDTVSQLTFSPKGVLNVPIFKATGYATGSLPNTSGVDAEGYIVFDSTTKQFKGWNGTIWVVLG